MLSIQQIRRFVEAKAFGQLLDRVLDNGRLVGRGVRACLRQPGAIGPAAVGLSLQRCCELTYGPTALAADLSNWLLDHQCFGPRSRSNSAGGPGEGLFGADLSTGAVAASAVAIRGLIDFAEQCQAASKTDDQSGGSGWAATETMDAAIQRGLRATAALQTDDGSFASPGTRTATGGAVADWIILWQLGDCHQFRAMIDFESFVHRVHNAAADLRDPELARLTRAIAA